MVPWTNKIKIFLIQYLLFFFFLRRKRKNAELRPLMAVKCNAVMIIEHVTLSQTSSADRFLNILMTQYRDRVADYSGERIHQGKPVCMR